MKPHISQRKISRTVTTTRTISRSGVITITTKTTIETTFPQFVTTQVVKQAKNVVEFSHLAPEVVENILIYIPFDDNMVSIALASKSQLAPFFFADLLFPFRHVQHQYVASPAKSIVEYVIKNIKVEKKLPRYYQALLYALFQEKPPEVLNTLIQWAATTGQFELCRIILEENPETVDPSADDSIAFQMACQNGHLMVVILLLLDKRCDPCADSEFSFRVACKRGHTEIVQVLLLDGRVDPADDNNIAIRAASFVGHLDVVKLLLESDE
ncbi:UNVERIFIED_CONTAM: hypothetical protein HDU68_010705, partial [Siphonaria sp. JEL0065]